MSHTSNLITLPSPHLQDLHPSLIVSILDSASKQSKNLQKIKSLLTEQYWKYEATASTTTSGKLTNMED